MTPTCELTHVHSDTSQATCYAPATHAVLFESRGEMCSLNICKACAAELDAAGERIERIEQPVDKHSGVEQLYQHSDIPRSGFKGQRPAMVPREGTAFAQVIQAASVRHTRGVIVQSILRLLRAYWRTV